MNSHENTIAWVWLQHRWCCVNIAKNFNSTYATEHLRMATSGFNLWLNFFDGYSSRILTAVLGTILLFWFIEFSCQGKFSMKEAIFVKKKKDRKKTNAFFRSLENLSGIHKWTKFHNRYFLYEKQRKNQMLFKLADLKNKLLRLLASVANAVAKTIWSIGFL